MRALRFVFLTAFAFGLCADAAGQVDPWFTRGPRIETLKLQALSGEWLLEYPRRDWVPVLGGGSAVAVVVQRNAEASLVLERTRTDVGLGRGEITDFFLVAEVELIKLEHPDASGFEQRIVGSAERRVYVVQFDRPGLKGPDRIRQYSFWAAGRLYRLLCRASRASFAKYDAMFSHVAASLVLKEEE